MLTALFVILVLIILISFFSSDGDNQPQEGAKTVEVANFARNKPVVCDYLNAIASAINEGKYEFVDGPAPFCKYVFVPAGDVGYFDMSGLAKITHANWDLLRTGYVTRENEAADELPYLERYFDSDEPDHTGYSVEANPVVCLATICYSKEQMIKEGIGCEADFAIITVNAEPFMGISPMTPCTHVRNALGIEFGGNDTPIDREAYRESVKFWSEWALVRNA